MQICEACKKFYIQKTFDIRVIFVTDLSDYKHSFRKIEVCARINLCGIRKLDLYTRKYKYSIDFLSSNNNSNNDDFGKFD